MSRTSRATPDRRQPRLPQVLGRPRPAEFEHELWMHDVTIPPIGRDRIGVPTGGPASHTRAVSRRYTNADSRVSAAVQPSTTIHPVALQPFPWSGTRPA